MSFFKARVSAIFTTRVIIKLFFFMTILLGIPIYLTHQNKKDIKIQIREGIRQELNHQLREAVRKELKSYITTRLDSEKKRQRGLLDLETEIEPNVDTPAKDTVTREIEEALNQEIRKMIRSELESYVGGELEIESPIAGGLRKRQGALQSDLAFSDEVETKRLAKAEAEEAESLSEESGIVAGREKSIESTLVQKGGMLLPKGKLQLEPSSTFAHFHSNRINIQGFSILPVLVIGEISTETVKRDIFIQALSLKYGILENFQGEVRIPYRYEHDTITDTLSRESTRESGGLGDVEFALSRQIAYERGIIPDTVATLSVKSDTGKSPYNRDIGLGTGHWGIRGALIAAKSSDPAVVFGSLGYTWNIERDIDNFGEVDPGDSIGYSLGAAIALSYQTAINFQFEHSLTSKMEKDGHAVPDSFLNVASLKSGLTWSISEKSSVDFSVSIGLTADTPDFVVEVRFPFAF